MREILCVVALAWSVAWFSSCGYGRAACQVIDTAADACVVLRYLEADGTERKVRVPRSELERFARSEASRQAAISSAETP